MMVRFAVALLSLCGAVAAPAASLAVSVVDQAAAPVADAVVTLSPLVAPRSAKPPAPIEIAQVNKTFVPQVSVAQVGAAVSFPNRDAIRHQVYSFSPTKIFELKLYAGVPVAPVVFDKPGLVVLGCNIHDRMLAWLVVVETPWFGKSDASGVVRIVDLPAGDYRLSIWHPYLSAEVPPRMVTVAGDASLRAAVELKHAL